MVRHFKFSMWREAVHQYTRSVCAMTSFPARSNLLGLYEKNRDMLAGVPLTDLCLGAYDPAVCARAVHELCACVILFLLFRCCSWVQCDICFCVG